MIWIALLIFICAAVPALLFIANLKLYVAPQPSNELHPDIAVLIPARNEEANMGDCLHQVLSNQGVTLEVIVLDDASTDRTADIVRAIAETDARVRLLSSMDLPEGWNGKQHACWRLAQAASSPYFLFLDADVRLHPSAVGDCVAQMRRTKVSLLSGFPRLITITPLEWLLLPLIHFVLLGFLPLSRMRSSSDPSFAAGCGQFMLVERTAYFTSGGHDAIRTTLHDGLLLPRSFRRAGFRTDLVDLTYFAKVRMYHSAATVWQGLAKNATEGIAAPKRIVPITLLLFLGQVVPTLLAVFWLMQSILQNHHTVVAGDSQPWNFLIGSIIFLAFIASYLPRLLALDRFQQPLKSAMLHPLGIVVLLCVQWYALACQMLGVPVSWRQRKYVSSPRN
jgi:glycosyltransferase involved in cell wall biosynthesis